MALKLKGDELRAAFARLRICLIEENDEHEIANKLGLTWAEVDALKKKFYDHEASIVRGESTEHTYVRYLIDQRACIADLDKIISDYEKQKNVSAIVSAVRVKSEILDRMIKLGQDFGLVERKAEGKSLAAGDAIRNMGASEIKQYIIKEIKVFNNMMLKFGDQDLMSMDPGPLYIPAQTEKKPVKGHARSKVSGGRRAVRGKSK
jgi:hypothetical protein